MATLKALSKKCIPRIHGEFFLQTWIVPYNNDGDKEFGS